MSTSGATSPSTSASRSAEASTTRRVFSIPFKARADAAAARPAASSPPGPSLWKQGLLVGVLSASATASPLLRIVAGSPTADTYDLSLPLIALAYALAFLAGGCLGGGVRILGAFEHTAFRAIVAALLFVNLALHAIVYGVGGPRFGRLLATVLDVWPVAVLCIALLAMVARVAARCTAAAVRKKLSAALTPIAALFAASSLCTDALDAYTLLLDRLSRAASESGITHPESRLSDPSIPAAPPRAEERSSPGNAAGNSVVHIVLDELSGSIMAEPSGLLEEAFHRAAPAGVYHPNAFTNSLWTIRAIPQALTGQLHPKNAPRPGVLEAYRKAGFQVRLYLAGGVLDCRASNSGHCYSARWAWREAIYRNDRIGYLGHQSRRLLRLYVERFLGQAWLQGEDPPLGPIAKAHRAGSSPSLMLFERFLEDLRRAQEPTYFFVHLLIPHPPYVHDRACNIVGDPSHSALNIARSSASGYLEQTYCANSMMRRLIVELIQLGRFDRTHLLVHSDHGPRGDLVDLLGQIPNEDLERPLRTSETKIAEVSTRIFLWAKPAGLSERHVDETPIELIDLAPWLLAQLEASQAPGVSQAPVGLAPRDRGAEISVLGLGEAKPGAGELKLVRARGSARWRIQRLDRGDED